MSLTAIVAGVMATLKTSDLNKRTLDLVEAQLEHLNSVVEKTSEDTSAKKVDELKKQHKTVLDDVKWHHENALDKLKKQHKTELDYVKRQHEIALNELKWQHENILNELKKKHSVSLNEKIKRLTRAKEELKRERDELRKDLEEVRRVSLLQKERCKGYLTEEEKEKRIKAVEETIWSDSNANYTDDSVSGFSCETHEYSDDELEWWNTVVEEYKSDLILIMENGESERFVKICWNEELLQGG